jgi:MFS family permease
MIFSRREGESGLKYPVPLPRPTANVPLLRLGGLFFLHSLAPGLWMISLGNVLNASGHGMWVALAFALGPVAALVSPLWVGSLADQRVEAQKLLRWLCGLSAIFLFLSFYSLQQGWGAGWFLFWQSLHSLFFTPTWSLVATVVFAHIPDPQRQFPLLRTAATVSWILAGIIISFGLKADHSPIGGLVASGVLVLVTFYTYWIPATPPRSPIGSGRRDWRAIFGLEALRIFSKGDFRVFLITTGCIAIPLAAYFPFAPQQLTLMGLENPTAWMTLGQVAETISMLCLGWFVLKWRVKWVMAFGLICAALRYYLLAIGAVTDQMVWVYPAMALHGLVFTFYFVTSQVFLEMRVPLEIRARAQALLTTVNGGIGSLLGALGSGWLHQACGKIPVSPLHQRAIFWFVLALFATGVLVYFLRHYRGRSADFDSQNPPFPKPDPDATSSPS